MGWQTFKLMGFAPDLPKTTPGILMSTQYCVPTDRGIGDGPAIADISSSALSTVSMGGALLAKTDATQELIVGTATKLYGFDLSTTLTDRSGGAYNASSTNTWSVTQFGNIALAANLGDQLQYRTIGAAANFASVGVAPVPKASIVVTCGPVSAPFVMVFDYADGVNTDRDGWKCSAISDYTGWTAGTNSCATGRLLDNVTGPVTAAIPYRDGVVAFKRTGMYVGRYDGPPAIWAWQRVSSTVGCIGKNAVAAGDDVIYFANDDGMWMYDGSYPRRIPGYCTSFWASTLKASPPTTDDRNYFHVVFDNKQHLVYFTQGQSTPSISGGLVFNTISGLWTILTSPVNAAQTVNAREFISAKYVISSNKKVSILSYGDTTPDHIASSFDGWMISDYVNTFKLKAVRPEWSYPATLSATNVSWLSGAFYTFSSERSPQPGSIGSPLNVVSPVARVPGKLDGMISGDIVSFNVSVAASNPWEVSGGIALNLDVTGKS